MFAVCQIQLNSTNVELFLLQLKCFHSSFLVGLPFITSNFQKTFLKKRNGLITATYAKFDLSLIEWIFMKVLLRLE